jgi:hypothetical protein
VSFRSDLRKRGIHAANILLLIREREGCTWDDLCRALSLGADDFHTGHTFLARELESLRRAGLVTFQQQPGEIWRHSAIQGEIAVTAAWQQIQQALGISLSQLAELDPDVDIIARPMFGRPEDASRKRDVFVLMPFVEGLRPMYEDHIKSVCSTLDLTVARADDFFSADSVMADVWAGIFLARALVADCTGRNPNVFYEIGLAHVLGKPVVLLTQNADDVPFDLRHIRVIKYTFTPSGMADFEQALSRTLRDVLRIRRPPLQG